jgi:hypothetical protein
MSEEQAEEIPVIEASPEPAPVDPKDVDKCWDGKGSLDDHRQKMFAEIKQPGFGTGKAE